MLPPEQIEKLVDKVVERLQRAQAPEPPRAPAYLRGSAPGIFDDLDQAVSAANLAFEIWKETRLQTRAKCIAAVRKVCLDRAAEIAQKAVAEPGLGRADPNVPKNRNATHTPPALEVPPPPPSTRPHHP